jgi:hypothetical protein
VGSYFGCGFVGQEMVEDEVAFAFEKFVLFRAVLKIIVNDLRCFHVVCHEIVLGLLVNALRMSASSPCDV